MSGQAAAAVWHDTADIFLPYGALAGLQMVAAM